MAELNARPFELGLAGAAVALTVVRLAEANGLVPCALCLAERWPYRLVVVLALIGLIWRPGRRLMLWLMAAALVLALAAAFVHVGVEFGWWASPLPECAAPVLRSGSARDLLASMPLRPSKPCDDPTYPISGLLVSLAQMNFLYALGLLGGVVMGKQVRRGLA